MSLRTFFKCLGLVSWIGISTSLAHAQLGQTGPRIECENGYGDCYDEGNGYGGETGPGYGSTAGSEDRLRFLEEAVRALSDRVRQLEARVGSGGGIPDPYPLDDREKIVAQRVYAYMESTLSTNYVRTYQHFEVTPSHTDSWGEHFEVRAEYTYRHKTTGENGPYTRLYSVRVSQAQNFSISPVN